MRPSEANHGGLSVGHPSDIGAIKRAVGVDTGNIGIVVAKVTIDQLTGVVYGRFVVTEDAQGVDALALVVIAADGGELGESGSVGAIPTFGRGVVLSHLNVGTLPVSLVLS